MFGIAEKMAQIRKDKYKQSLNDNFAQESKAMDNNLLSKQYERLLVKSELLATNQTWQELHTLEQTITEKKASFKVVRPYGVVIFTKGVKSFSMELI